jgi:hypothetical protein
MPANLCDIRPITIRISLLATTHKKQKQIWCHRLDILDRILKVGAEIAMAKKGPSS